MGRKIDTRAVGLDTGLAFIRWLTGAENLHYGLWSGLDVCAGNLRAAQEAYTAKLFGYLPRQPLRILDIGGGAGETATKLMALGHTVEIVVPSEILAGRCRQNAPDAKLHRCSFEGYAGGGPFDLCLFSESFQYIALAESLPKCADLLAPGGAILIADCFRTDLYKGRNRHGPQPGGGHKLSAFRAAAERCGLSVVAEEDITEAVAPSIDLEQQLFHVIGDGVTWFSEEIRRARPASHWVLGRLIRLVLPSRRRVRLMRRLTANDRTVEAFRRYNRYMILDLRAKPHTAA